MENIYRFVFQSIGSVVDSLQAAANTMTDMIRVNIFFFIYIKYFFNCLNAFKR